MAPTIVVGDRIAVNKCAYWGEDIERFDIVVFRFPLNRSMFFSKRVVGLPGESLYFRDGNIHVRGDGEEEFTPVELPPSLGDTRYSGRRRSGLRMDSPDNAVKIPRDSYFVVGDNTFRSHDNRGWEKHTFELRGERMIICESQEIHRRGERWEDQYTELGYAEEPDYLVRYDIEGNHHGFSEEDILSHTWEPLVAIGEEFILWRVTKIWWPLDRAGPLR